MKSFAQQSRSEGQEIVLTPEPVNTYQAEIEEFSQAVIDDREPLINGDLGLRSQKILTACYESAGSGVVVEVS